MSLISEALKKARQEAARQDAQRQRSPYAVGVADAAERRTGLVPVLAGVGAGCLAAGLILAFAWSAGWGPFARTVKPAEQVSQAAPALPPAPVEPALEPSAPPPAMIEEEVSTMPDRSPRLEPPPVQDSRPQPNLEVRPPAPAEAPVAPPVPTPAAPPPVRVEVEEDNAPAAVSPSVPAPPAPVRPSSAGEGNLVDGQTYVGEVPIPGGGALKLNGIAFSQDRPVAVLDGRVMGPGELIQGFTITAIEAGRVKLQGYGTTVFVSPR